MNPFEPGTDEYTEWQRQEDEQEPTGRRVRLRPVADIPLQIPKWLWHWRIPLGAITLLAGKPGTGKSTTGAWLAAAVTRGLLPGRFARDPAAVAVIATEDHYGSVVVPRLLAAGADLDMVYQVDVEDMDSPFGTVSLPADLPQLRVQCTDGGVKLVLCDPLMSLIHASLDTHKDREVRKALDPLASFAADTRISVVGLIHLNKSGTTDPLRAIMASGAFAAVARSVLFATPRPADDDGDDEESEMIGLHQGSNYLLGQPKSNLGPKTATLRYHIEEHRIQLETPDEDGEDLLVTSKIIWDGEDSRDIYEALESLEAKKSRPGPPTGERYNEIVKIVNDYGHPMSVDDILLKLPGVTRNGLRVYLSRGVKRGDISRSALGHYTPSEKQQAGNRPLPSRVALLPLLPVLPRNTRNTQQHIRDSPETYVAGIAKNGDLSLVATPGDERARDDGSRSPWSQITEGEDDNPLFGHDMGWEDS